MLGRFTRTVYHVPATRACSAWGILRPWLACVVEVELAGGPESVEGMVRPFPPCYCVR